MGLLKKNQEVDEDITSLPALTYVTINNDLKQLKGIYKGFMVQPWPAAIIDDGGAVYAVSMNFKIKDFLQRTAIPAGCTFEIIWKDSIDVKNGRTMNVYDFNVTNLPESYDKKLLENAQGKIVTEIKPGIDMLTGEVIEDDDLPF